MSDVLTPQQRALNMSRIRGRDTKPEMRIRRGLHARGLRFRLHQRALPGCPDLVFPRYHTVVFIHGCFWHAHGCSLSKIPSTRREFWTQKLGNNVARDHKAIAALQADGWRILVVWECALRGPGRRSEAEVLDLAANFIQASASQQFEITAAERRDESNA